MLFQSFPDNSLEFLVAMFQKMWIKDRFLDVRMNVELLFDLFENFAIVAILIRFNSFEQSFDDSMVRL